MVPFCKFITIFLSDCASFQKEFFKIFFTMTFVEVKKKLYIIWGQYVGLVIMIITPDI